MGPCSSCSCPDCAGHSRAESTHRPLPRPRSPSDAQIYNAPEREFEGTAPRDESQWANVDLNRKLLSYATENDTTAVGLLQKLGQAKNLEEVVKIQTDFISKQMVSFNEQTKTIVEICTKAAQDMTKHST
jgi:hypothetical protein